MKACVRCQGTGEYMGNGFMITDCDLCNDNEDEVVVETKLSVDKIDKRSVSYRDAIKSIMDLNPSISRKDAVKMFDEAYDDV